MAGIILMIVGGIVFTLGLVKTLASSEPKNEKQIIQEVSIQEPIIKHDTIVITEKAEQEVKEKEVQNQAPKSDNELQNVIAMAIADGVLTKNEKDAIRKIASEKTLDYEAIIIEVEQKLKQNNIEAETEIIDQIKKKGNDFEKYVVGKFDKKYFKLKEWAGDKYVNGTYAETTLHPDLVLVFTLKGNSKTFAVECKWRKKLFNDGIEFANNDQLARYKKFEKQQNIKVFVAVGTGGEAANPKYLSIIPLSEIETTFLSLELLKKHNKNTEKNFYYDFDSERLN